MKNHLQFHLVFKTIICLCLTLSEMPVTLVWLLCHFEFIPPSTRSMICSVIPSNSGLSCCCFLIIFMGVYWHQVLCSLIQLFLYLGPMWKVASLEGRRFDSIFHLSHIDAPLTKSLNPKLPTNRCLSE